jgi:hypothetical protein
MRLWHHVRVFVGHKVISSAEVDGRHAVMAVPHVQSVLGWRMLSCEQALTHTTARAQGNLHQADGRG